MTFGEFIEELRIDKGYTLREFCMKFGYDAGNHSKLERGLRKPPEDPQALEKLATDLGIEKSSELWDKFSNLAFVTKKEYKFVKLNNEQLLEKLPVLFRAVDRPDLTEQELDQLIEIVRRTHESD